MFVQGSHAFAMFYAHALHDKPGIPVMHAHILCRRPLPDLIKIGVQAACLHFMALLCIQLDYVVISRHFFFCLVYGSLKHAKLNN